MIRRVAVTLAGAVWLTLVPVASTGAAIATRVDGGPFLARRDIFEYLLNHLVFTTQVTQALPFARLRMWQTPEELALDEG